MATSWGTKTVVSQFPERIYQPAEFWVEVPSYSWSSRLDRFKVDNVSDVGIKYFYL